MSIVDILLEELLTTELTYKGLKVNMLGLPILGKYRQQSITNAIYRLHKNKYIEKNDRSIRISARGRQFLKQNHRKFKTFDGLDIKDTKKKLLFIFDIPEERRGERQWLRIHLKKFGYKMVQQSVWLGPAEFPKDFLEYIKYIKLREHIKMFKVTD